ncbi:MAG: hypothetical protein MHM6MM_003345 [Cercozoa sp. M6MM]
MWGIQRSSPGLFAVLAGVVVFTTYAATYCIRFPTFVPTYKDRTAFGVELKSALTIAQSFGYILFKIPTVVYFPKLPKRAWMPALIACYAWSTVCLALMGWFTSGEGKVVMTFLCAAGLTPVYALIVRFLEGRKITEPLTAMLLFATVVTGGMARSIGAWFLTLGVAEAWMPLVVALCAAPVYCLSSYLLHTLPPPTEEDRSLRQARLPMTIGQQKQWSLKFWQPLSVCAVWYIAAVGYRMFRDYFQTDIMEELMCDVGQDPDECSPSPLVYTLTEFACGSVVLAAVVSLTPLKNNYKAFFLTMLYMAIGSGPLLIGGTALLSGSSPLGWMVSSGTGVSLGGSMLIGAPWWDRLMAAAGDSYTVSFLCYWSDFFGHSGTIGVVFYKEFFTSDDVSFASFFESISYVAGAFMLFCCMLATVLFRWKLPKPDGDSEATEALLPASVSKDADSDSEVVDIHDMHAHIGIGSDVRDFQNTGARGVDGDNQDVSVNA